MTLTETLKLKTLNGGSIDRDEALQLMRETDRQAVWEAAEEITRRLLPRRFDSCSIVNARSGGCSENCKWCAQSAHFATGCNRYELIDEDACIAEARHNRDKGVQRFSLVASGRAVKGEAFDHICALLRRVNREVGISTCASLGLIDLEAMKALKQSGVTRYHCNLETAPSHFATLCTTHTIEDKIATLSAAREAGLEVCSGGIIGMGETPEQRIEFALALRRVSPVSIPVNILCPIPGTPLENAAPLTDTEIMDTVAMMRFIHPTAMIRFAGGRSKMSRETQLHAMRIAVNGAIVGDLLTTVGSQIDADKSLTHEAGYEF